MALKDWKKKTDRKDLIVYRKIGVGELWIKNVSNVYYTVGIYEIGQRSNDYGMTYYKKYKNKSSALAYTKKLMKKL